MKRYLLAICYFVVFSFLFLEYGYCIEDCKNVGLYGCRLEEVVIDGSDANSSNHYAYARIETPPGIHKAKVGEANWVRLGFDEAIMSIGITQNDGRIYAGTTTAIYYSDDGVGWTEVNTVQDIRPIVVTSSNNIYIGARDSSDSNNRNIYKSTDSGATWVELLSTGISTNQFTGIAVSSDETVIWGTIDSSGTVYRWTLSGGSWTQSTFDLTSVLPGFQGLSVAIDPNNNAIVYVDGSVNNAGKLIKTSNGTNASPTFVEKTGFGGMGSVYISSDSSVIYKASSKSIDGGDSWTALPPPIVGLNVNYTVAIHPGDNNILYVGTDQGIACSTDGAATFVEIDEDLEGVQIYGGHQDPSDPDILVIASKSGVGRSSDAGATWSYVLHGAPWLCTAVNATGSRAYIGGNGADVSESIDTGATWSGDVGCRTEVEGDITSGAANGMALDSNNPDILYVAVSKFNGIGGGVYKGTRGTPWTWAEATASTALPYNCVHAYADGANTVVLAGYGDTQSNASSSGLKRSTNGGGSWANISDLSGNVVRCIATDPNTSTTLYAGIGYGDVASSGAIYKSTDGGATWTKVHDLSENACVAITVDPDDSTQVYAAAENKIYTSNSSGNPGTWYTHYIGVAGESFYSLFMFEELASASSLSKGFSSNSRRAQATDSSLSLGSEAGLYSYGASDTWYFAEGYTADGFDVYLLIMNPNAQASEVTATYFKTDGTTVEENYSIGATSRYTVHVDEISGLENTELSIKVTTTNDVSVICERAIYWNDMQKGHCTVGVTAPSSRWYFAEGSTVDYDLYILLQNPNSTAANVALTFMPSVGETYIHNTTVAANSRATVNVGSVYPDKHISTRVDSDLEIVAERAMYWNNMAGGHCSTGTTSASNTWYLAEGYTGGDYNTWVLIQNPNSNSVNCDVTFLINGGDPVEQEITINGDSRYSINVNSILNDAEVSTVVDAGDDQVIVERAMYWGGTDGDGHCSMGTKTLAVSWLLAEGYTGGNFQEWILLMNPTAYDATVSISYILPDGSTIDKSYSVSANSRFTISVDAITGLENTSVSASITSDVAIAVERAMYFVNGDTSGGHNSPGVRQ